ncbi:MAG: heavy metal translocating P-type ATPase [Candidatus Alectryocaccobium sp.]|nr:heavy metal translocating P-type ATPase [Candidatus Alectryocaccobium sp.]
MTQYTVKGMSCAACQARVEKAVNSAEGVDNAVVNLLTNSMTVEGDAAPEAVIEAVRNAGYDAELFNDNKETGGKSSFSSNITAREEMLEDHATPLLKKRLVASIVFLCVLMYFSMGHMMRGWPLPPFFNDNHVAMGLFQMLLTIIVMVINQRFFISGYKALFNKAPNMDTLVALGSSAAFAWSTYALFQMTGAVVRMDTEAVMVYMNELYFESAAMILTLITIGKMLEARAKGKTTDALKSLIKLAPKTASVIRNGKEIQIPIDQVEKGDIFTVKPGETVPVDGVVIDGRSAVNESMLTGESIPVDKEVGTHVSAATLNQSGFLKCRATRVGEDTAFAKIIKLVSDAAATKAPIAKIADKVSGVFVPAVMSIALVTFIIWMLAGEDIAFSLARAISVLVISCPCALGLATPVAIMVASGVGAKNGILFKTAVSLEESGKIDVAVLDKTGTITKGEPHVTDIIPIDGTKESLLQFAFTVEVRSEHPLARAINTYADERKIKAFECEDFEVNTGQGVTAVYDGRVIEGGSVKYIGTKVFIDDNTRKIAEELSDEGKTPLAFTYDGRLLGMIAVADVLKDYSREAIAELKDMGVRVVMLTGDNAKTAAAIGKQAGVDEVIAGVLPDGKEAVISELQSNTKTVNGKVRKLKVAMVGDGINDAPALTRADVGIAIGAGTDVAIESADIVLMKSDLADLPAAIKLGRGTLRNIHQNLFWAFFYNVCCIPLAAGAFISTFGWTLNPMIGAAAMSLSSVFVVTNALRLNFIKLYKNRNKAVYGEQQGSKVENIIDNDIKNETEEKENETMEKVLKVDGMMCMHCEATVKKALEEIDGVAAAYPNHEKKEVRVELDKDVADDILEKAITDKGYTII